MGKIILLKPEQIKEQHPIVYEVLFKEERRLDETLHQYLLRKNIKCGCVICRQAKLL